jgi:hypothetical protein
MSINRTAPANRSGVIAVGGVAQAWLAASTARGGFRIRNLSAGTLWISAAGAATMDKNSFPIYAGEYFETPPNMVPPNAISIIGATTGQEFFGEEY